jgi:hypothetical protein
MATWFSGLGKTGSFSEFAQIMQQARQGYAAALIKQHTHETPGLGSQTAQAD